MKTVALSHHWEFHEANPYAEPLHVASDGRVLRFTLRRGQMVKEHTAPSSPVFIVILHGSGLFTGGDGTEQRLGFGSMVVYEAGEPHAIWAVDEDLVFLAILHGAPISVK